MSFTSQFVRSFSVNAAGGGVVGATGHVEHVNRSVTG